MKIQLRLYILLLLWLLLPTLAKAENVTASGQAAVINNNLPGAEQQALYQARRNALTQVIGVRVQASATVENYQLVEDKIYTQVEGYIRSEQILERKEADGVFMVTIRADVLGADLERDYLAIRALYQRLDRPRIAVLVQIAAQDANLLTPELEHAAQSLLVSELQELGFIITGGAASASVAEVDWAFTANIAVGRPIVAGAAMKPVRLSWNMVATNVGLNSVLASVRGQTNKVHINPQNGGHAAITAAILGAVPALVAKVVAHWENSLYEDRSLVVEIVGLTAVEPALKIVAGLKKSADNLSEQVIFRGYHQGKAEVEIRSAVAMPEYWLRLKQVLGARYRLVSLSSDKITVTPKTP